jgi:phosphonopyruvate decarboxylase
MKKDDVEPYELQRKRESRQFVYINRHKDDFSLPYEERCVRTDALKAIQAVSTGKSIVVATTGKTGRELYELDDRENQIYMVGSMGCALAFGFGLAYVKPDFKVYVIDGDGALLMRTGSMATVGAYAPQNLVHILLDNEVHDSTGGQSTVSHNVSFGAIAAGFGYPNVHSTDKLSEFSEIISGKTGDGPAFVHLKIKKGSPKTLGRPGVKPYQVKDRLAAFIQNNS